MILPLNGIIFVDYILFIETEILFKQISNSIQKNQRKFYNSNPLLKIGISAAAS